MLNEMGKMVGGKVGRIIGEIKSSVLGMLSVRCLLCFQLEMESQQLGRYLEPRTEVSAGDTTDTSY